ncbi:GDP-mannose 4,6-dehydratase [Desulfobotulus mexicanus]|uniref:GDP-mannose 4,6-dehydratase n=1 Tax=Desulfobotulus mexicanus TaxID=2586642 RepID=A0A5Q4VH36_9BACT|nr:GDP-mannose 4,6-dehydratase [Desulfobotulus mexicanus]TYT75291.1 GDP-mannose 4,6-dehydratase [Desulfobotulus mexicanus]
MKKALVTGVTGQDGAYLARLLLNKNYEVYGAYRRSSSSNFWRMESLGVLEHPNLHLVEYDLTDAAASVRLVEDIEPDEIYNLAAQSFVGVSFDQPLATAHITGLGPVNLLEAIRIVNPKIRFYQASTSEMFGKALQSPQNEKTPFYPGNPYGAAKLYAHWMTVNYRDAYGIFAASGILFNHESPLRGMEFVTRKISDTVAKISLGKKGTLELGNMNARRDWGYAEEYVEGMWKMLQVEKPGSYVLATGRTHTVREFVNLAFRASGMEILWRGEGLDEEGFDRDTGKVRVRVNPKFYRPTEVDVLVGDASRAKKELGWDSHTGLEELCRMMVEADYRRHRDGLCF